MSVFYCIYLVIYRLSDGSLTTVATNFNANEDTDTTKITAEVHHISVDGVKAAQQVEEASSAVAAAKNELRDAKDQLDRGEITEQAYDDHKTNLVAATVNLANAQINLGSTLKSGAATYGTGGFSGSINGEHSKTTSTDTQSQGEWQGTKITAGNTTILGDDATLIGVSGDAGNLNIDNLTSLTLKAGTNTSSSSSNSTTNAQTASVTTTGSISVGASTQQNSSQSHGVTHTNTQLNVDSLNGHADTTTLNGGIIHAGGGNYTTDKLIIETVQDTYTASSTGSGANVGINLSGGIPSGGSIGANKSNGSVEDITAADQSGIIYSSDDHTLTVGDTINKGGIIAHIQTDSEGNQVEHNVNFTTDTLETQDLVNTKFKDNSNFGGSIGVGVGDKGSINNIGIQAGHTGQEFESKTLTTVGTGAVVTGDAITGQDSLANVNRDALNTELVIKDVQTGALAVDANIDARVFTEAGRDEIIAEQQDIGENVKKVTAITGTDALKVPAVIAAVIDKGNANPDSQDKSTLDKIEDNITQLDNNLKAGMGDDTVDLVAAEELIAEGKLTNDVYNQEVLDQISDKMATGTDAEKADVYLVEDLTDTREGVYGSVVLGSANETTGTDIYLDNGALDRSDNVTIANGQEINIEGAPSTIAIIGEEITHSNGQGEDSASIMGDLSDKAYSLSKWANSDDIADTKDKVNVSIINNSNTAKEQQDQLADNKQQLKDQQEAGDEFENGGIYDGTVPGYLGEADEIRNNPNYIKDYVKDAEHFLEGGGAEILWNGVNIFIPLEVGYDTYKALNDPNVSDSQKSKMLAVLGFEILPITKIAGKAKTLYKVVKSCFTAGTLIETKNGLKPIETIQQGDFVWSRHEDTLEYGYKPVTGTGSFKDKEIYEVVVQDSNGNTETFSTTEEHPFWVDGSGWIPATALMV